MRVADSENRAVLDRSEDADFEAARALAVASLTEAVASLLNVEVAETERQLVLVCRSDVSAEKVAEIVGGGPTVAVVRALADSDAAADGENEGAGVFDDVRDRIIVTESLRDAVTVALCRRLEALGRIESDTLDDTDDAGVSELTAVPDRVSVAMVESVCERV